MRNESDIIESFVRFNLSVLDELWVADNGSTDTTQEVLRRLSDEYPSLHVRHAEYRDHRQELALRVLLRDASSKRPFDFAFLLDADEFIKCDDRQDIEAALVGLGAGFAGCLEWVTYLPTLEDDWSEPDVLRRMRYRRTHEPRTWQKVVLPFSIATSAELRISPGSHGVSVGDLQVQQLVLKCASLAHFPLRSPEQAASKVLLGEWSLSLKPWRGASEGYHWRLLAEQIAKRGLLSREQLVEVAAEYASQGSRSSLVAEPISLTRYPGLQFPELIDVDPIKRLATFGNQYFSSISRTLYANDYMSVGRTRFGPLGYLAADTVIGRSIGMYGEWAAHELDLLLPLLNSGDTVIDVGANIGTHTIPFAQRVGPFGRVYAFEPQRTVYQLLCGNAALNGLRNVYGAQMAVSDSDGVIRISNPELLKGGNIGNYHLQETSDGEIVPVVQLDKLDLPRARLVKIDVEGMELRVLRGAQTLISRDRPLLFLENNIPEQSEAILRELEGLYYTAYWHFADYYNGANFFGNTTNFLSAVGRPEINLLCIPTEDAFVPVGVERVGDVSETWQMGYGRWRNRHKHGTIVGIERRN